MSLNHYQCLITMSTFCFYCFLSFLFLFIHCCDLWWSLIFCFLFFVRSMRFSLWLQHMFQISQFLRIILSYKAWIFQIENDFCCFWFVSNSRIELFITRYIWTKSLSLLFQLHILFHLLLSFKSKIFLQWVTIHFPRFILHILLFAMLWILIVFL